MNELSNEAENDIVEYYIEKSKSSHDWYWREAQRISGAADYLESDAGMHWSDNKK